jgi:hypothetical protein
MDGPRQVPRRAYAWAVDTSAGITTSLEVKRTVVEGHFAHQLDAMYP